MKGISGWQQLDIGPYQGWEVPGSWNAERLPWGAVDASLGWGAVLWAAELQWGMLLSSLSHKSWCLVLP